MADFALCPHCAEETKALLSFEGLGDHRCDSCDKVFSIVIDEDIDCNYWFEAVTY